MSVRSDLGFSAYCSSFGQDREPHFVVCDGNVGNRVGNDGNHVGNDGGETSEEHRKSIGRTVQLK